MAKYEIYQRLFESAVQVEKALPKITQVFEDKGIDFCLVGGVSLRPYGLKRSTEDVDILVFAGHSDKIQDLVGTYMRPKFPGAKKKFIWNDGNVNIDILFSGEISGDGVRGLPFEDPKQLRVFIGDSPFISLKNLIQYKLSSYLYSKPQRLKDAADVQQLIQINALPMDYANSFREDIKDAYFSVWAEPVEETDDSF